jgi:isoleucyl-tRNA synthetase
MSKTANLQIQILQAYEHYNFHQVMQLILNFCSNDLGGFYLDVIKDRQYTTKLAVFDIIHLSKSRILSSLSWCVLGLNPAVFANIKRMVLRMRR